MVAEDGDGWTRDLFENECDRKVCLSSRCTIVADYECTVDGSTELNNDECSVDMDVRFESPALVEDDPCQDGRDLLEPDLTQVIGKDL